MYGCTAGEGSSMLTWGLLTNSIGPLRLKGSPEAARCLPQRHSAPCQMDHNPLKSKHKKQSSITKWLPTTLKRGSYSLYTQLYYWIRLMPAGTRPFSVCPSWGKEHFDAFSFIFCEIVLRTHQHTGVVTGRLLYW